MYTYVERVVCVCVCVCVRASSHMHECTVRTCFVCWLDLASNMSEVTT